MFNSDLKYEVEASFWAIKPENVSMEEFIELVKGTGNRIVEIHSDKVLIGKWKGGNNNGSNNC